MRDYVQRERDGVPHPLPREPPPEPEVAAPPERIQRTDEMGLPPLRSYYGELIRAKWFTQPASPKRVATGGTSAGLRPHNTPVRVPTSCNIALLPIA